MDVNPTIVQLVDGMEFPVLPRNPSVNDPLGVWYIKVFYYSSPDSFWFSFTNTGLLALPSVYTRRSRCSRDDHEELR